MEKNNIRSGKGGRKDIVSEIFNFMDAWLKQAVSSKSRHTVEAYKFAMDLYILFLGESLHVSTKNLAWECFSRENIEKWMTWLTDRGNKPQTVTCWLSRAASCATAVVASTTTLSCPTGSGHVLSAESITTGTSTPLLTSRR